MKSFDLAPLLAGKTLGTGSDSFVIAEWRDAGGTFDSPRLIAPRHIHHSDDEAWYVLEGKLRVEMGDGEVELPAGAVVMVPRGSSCLLESWARSCPVFAHHDAEYPSSDSEHPCDAGADSCGVARSLQTARFGIFGIDRAENFFVLFSRVLQSFSNPWMGRTPQCH